MGFQITHIPDALNDEGSPTLSIHWYSALKPCALAPVQLSQNLICFVLNGRKEVHTLGLHSVVDSGNILLLPTSNVLMTERLKGDTSYQSILVFLSDSFLVNFLKKIQMVEVKANASAKGLGILPMDPYLWNYVASLKLLGLAEPLVGGLGQTKVEELLMYLYRKDPAQLFLFLEEAKRRGREPKIAELMNHPDVARMSMTDMAFLCHMSLSTFKRKFHEHFKMAPGQYLIKKKMELAQIWLQSAKAPSEIYLELGYGSLSSFSREYKKYFGMPPKDTGHHVGLKSQ